METGELGYFILRSRACRWTLKRPSSLSPEDRLARVWFLPPRLVRERRVSRDPRERERERERRDGTRASVRLVSRLERESRFPSFFSRILSQTRRDAGAPRARCLPPRATVAICVSFLTRISTVRFQSDLDVYQRAPNVYLRTPEHS